MAGDPGMRLSAGRAQVMVGDCLCDTKRYEVPIPLFLLAQHVKAGVVALSEDPIRSSQRLMALKSVSFGKSGRALMLSSRLVISSFNYRCSSAKK